MIRWIAALVLVIAAAAPAAAVDARQVDFPLRGKTLTLQVYFPARIPTATIIMSSGDVGWVGVGVSMAEFLSDRGYLVIGVNIRQYLSAFRTNRGHLTVNDPPADYRAMADFLREQHLIYAPVYVSGMSEGAALAVLVASDARNHEWISGVVTMGIPATAELAWKWSDFTSWITKHDPDEPTFSPYDFVADVAPVPIVMIQSRKDEYVPPDDYQRCHAKARDPKKLVLIDASNHRFTDRKVELQREYLAALAWIQTAR